LLAAYAAGARSHLRALVETNIGSDDPVQRTMLMIDRTRVTEVLRRRIGQQNGASEVRLTASDQASTPC